MISHSPMVVPVTCYLDHNATTPLRPAAREAMIAAAEAGGNPSSVHAAGRQARERIEWARQAVAGLIGRPPAEIVFTSGGTEADLLALTGPSCARVLTSAIEHDAVLAPVSEAVRIPVTGAGRLDVEALATALSAPAGRGRVLVSVMWVNNETGVVQPIAEVARLTHAAGGLLHVDAVQGAGRRDVAEIADADLISLSAHKIGGPQGVGALAVRDGLSLRPAIRGGGQEKGRRSGTENGPGIAGFGAAAAELAAVWRQERDRIAGLRDRLERAVSDTAPEAVILGAAAERVGNTSAIGLPGVSAEIQVMALDLDGVMVSAGSACSSGKVKSSHVIEAMRPGDPIAGQTIRVSLGWSTAEADVDRFLDAWCRMRSRLSPAAHAA